MKFKISYFARIRKFAPDEVPVSTAMWDPKWYHPAGKPKGTFVDKRGVINGLRADPFKPGHCFDGCEGPRDCLWRPSACTPIERYRKQLAELDANDIIDRFKDLERRLMEKYPDKFPDGVTFVLCVYETPSNGCSERGPIMEWFYDNGYSIEEWEEVP